MDFIKTNPILKFNENQLQDVRKVLGYADVNKLKQDIEHLRDWIKKQNHFMVKEFEDEYLERLLIYNKGSIERTKQKFDRLCTCMNLMPEFLRNFDVKNEFNALRNVADICMLPRPSKDNYRITVTNITGTEDNDLKLIDYFRYFILFVQYSMYHDYCLGYEFILNFKNITSGTVSKINPVVIQKGLTLIVEAMGYRMKKIHLISGSKFFDVILMMIMQALSKKLKERVVIHSNFDTLFEHFPSIILPEDFGGTEKSIKELQDSVFKEISSDDHIARIKSMEKMATDESRRLSCKFNEEYSGMPGSFKTLCVD